MEKAHKRRKILFRIGIFITICGVLTTAIINTVMKDWLIIGYGIRAYVRTQRISGVIIIIGVLCLLCYGIFVLKWLCKQRRQEKAVQRSRQDRSQVLVNYVADSLNPEYMRKRLELLGQENPEFQTLVNACLKQMDEMDSLQEKQNNLISLNDASYLRETANVLDNVERHICGNLRNIINLCIAADTNDDLDLRKVEQNLNNSQATLSDARSLIRASADWINQYNNDANSSDTSEVERWLSVIRDSLREG